MNNLEKVYNYVLEKTEGKYDNSRYISRFNSLDEMLEELEMSVGQVQSETFPKQFDITTINTPFIVSDYSKESFVFLTTDNEEDIQRFIDYITAK